MTESYPSFYPSRTSRSSAKKNTWLEISDFFQNSPIPSQTDLLLLEAVSEAAEWKRYVEQDIDEIQILYDRRNDKIIESPDNNEDSQGEEDSKYDKKPSEKRAKDAHTTKVELENYDPNKKLWVLSGLHQKPTESLKSKAFEFSLPAGEGLRRLNATEDFKLPWSIYAPIISGEKHGFKWKNNLQTNLWTVPNPFKSAQHDESKCSCSSGLCNLDCVNRYDQRECFAYNCIFEEEDCGNRQFTNLTKALASHKDYASAYEIIPTKQKGLGLIALRSFNENTLIVEYTGEVVTLNEVEHRLETIYKSTTNYYFLGLENDLIIDAGKKGSAARFVNHSCDPNCEIQKWYVNGEPRIGLFAKKYITPGEEITYDYNFEWFENSTPQVCYCGSKNCRRFIGKKAEIDKITEESPSDVSDFQESSDESEEPLSKLSIYKYDTSLSSAPDKTQTTKSSPSRITDSMTTNKSSEKTSNSLSQKAKQPLITSEILLRRNKASDRGTKSVNKQKKENPPPKEIENVTSNENKSKTPHLPSKTIDEDLEPIENKESGDKINLRGNTETRTTANHVSEDDVNLNKIPSDFTKGDDSDDKINIRVIRKTRSTISNLSEDEADSSDIPSYLSIDMAQPGTKLDITALPTTTSISNKRKIDNDHKKGSLKAVENQGVLVKKSRLVESKPQRTSSNKSRLRRDNSSKRNEALKPNQREKEKEKEHKSDATSSIYSTLSFSGLKKSKRTKPADGSNITQLKTIKNENTDETLPPLSSNGQLVHINPNQGNNNPENEGQYNQLQYDPYKNRPSDYHQYPQYSSYPYPYPSNYGGPPQKQIYQYPQNYQPNLLANERYHHNDLEIKPGEHYKQEDMEVENYYNQRPTLQIDHPKNHQEDHRYQLQVYNKAAPSQAKFYPQDLPPTQSAENRHRSNGQYPDRNEKYYGNLNPPYHASTIPNSTQNSSQLSAQARPVDPRKRRNG